jgi:hypothetical protein
MSTRRDPRLLLFTIRVEEDDDDPAGAQLYIMVAKLLGSEAGHSSQSG